MEGRFTDLVDRAEVFLFYRRVARSVLVKRARVRGERGEESVIKVGEG